MAALQTNITVLPFSFLQVLPDNPGNKPHRHIALLINMRNDKGYLILFPYGTGIIAGMGDGVDANREPDEYGAFVDIFHNTGIFALHLAFLHIFLAGIAFYAFDICMDGNLLRRLCFYIQDPYQDVIPHTEPLPGVSQPVKG